MIRVLLASLLVSLAFGCAAPEDTTSTEAVDAPAADAEPQVVTVYSSRHSDADEQIYDAFEAETGIAVEVVAG
ncbi:MAG: Fe(3+) ABC transporter substrate-binding protein, partial [Acidobacteriota bacterium]